MQQLTTSNTSWKWNTKEYIVLHHTASWYDSINWVLNWFKNTQAQVSAHYVIDTNWDIYKFNTNDDILRHAGTSFWEWKSWLNQYTIWIEIIWPLPWFTNSQKKAVRLLVLDLMKNHKIPYNKIIRHKDIAPNRKVDVDDNFWENEYSTFSAYQKSYNDIQIITGLYEKIFKKEFTDLVEVKETIITDLQWAEDNLIKVNGSFDVKDFIYLYNIWIERVKKELLFYNNTNNMWKYEKVFKKEFADLIANDDTVFSDVDGAISNCINDDWTLNLRELLYFMNIGLERVRKEWK